MGCIRAVRVARERQTVDRTRPRTRATGLAPLSTVLGRAGADCAGSRNTDRGPGAQSPTLHTPRESSVRVSASGVLVASPATVSVPGCTRETLSAALSKADWAAPDHPSTASVSVSDATDAQPTSSSRLSSVRSARPASRGAEIEAERVGASTRRVAARRSVRLPGRPTPHLSRVDPRRTSDLAHGRNPARRRRAERRKTASERCCWKSGWPNPDPQEPSFGLERWLQNRRSGTLRPRGLIVSRRGHTASPWTTPAGDLEARRRSLADSLLSYRSVEWIRWPAGAGQSVEPSVPATA
ncbi:hypothetical protein FOHLNKBM_4884 [Methylobacterium longum]|nr:hypothetical protein FOHLNKBM_4884 [Methylobacterium longum]